MKIKYVVKEILKPKFESKYSSVKNASFVLNHGVGIDTGTVLSVRSGVRGNNDLIWIGRAPNLAAKLSDLRTSSRHQSFITSTVYNKLSDKSKYSKGKNMWEEHVWAFLGEKIKIYRSSWRWKP